MPSATFMDALLAPVSKKSKIVRKKLNGDSVEKASICTVLHFNKGVNMLFMQWNLDQKKLPINSLYVKLT